ncbi:MAG: cyclic nucleotide-binding domain-containing protein, partial [Nitrospinota bacterium]
MANPPNLLEKLKQFPLLNLLHEKEFGPLISGGKQITLKPGRLLFEEGGKKSGMYLILEGELKIFVEDTPIALRGPGEYIGEMSVIDESYRSASCKSTTETELFEIDKNLFDSLFAKKPEILMELLKTVTWRAREDLGVLKNKNLELQEFAQIASHDLQEPLRKIINFGSLLKESTRNLDEKSRDYIQRMQNSTARMQRFIDDLLNYSKIGMSPLDFESVDLKKLVHSVCEDLNHLILLSRAEINVADLPEIKGAKSRLYQLFFNLLMNSLKFKKEDESPVINFLSRKNENNEWEICV